MVISSNFDALQKHLVSIMTSHALAVSSLNALGKYDWARSAEHFFQAIAELVFDESFELADLKKSNNPVFDLKSPARLIQVTSQRNSEKIKGTLKGHRDTCNARLPIYFFLIGDKPDFGKNTFARFNFCQTLIWGTTELIKELSAKGIECLQQACTIAELYLVDEHQRLHTTKSEVLQQLELLMENVHEFRGAQIQNNHAELMKVDHDGTYANLRTLIGLLDRHADAILSGASMLHESTSRGECSLRDAQMYYHGLARRFIEVKSRFKRIVPNIEHEIALKNMIDKLEDAHAKLNLATAELAAAELESAKVAKEVASLEFEIKFLAP